MNDTSAIPWRKRRAPIDEGGPSPKRYAPEHVVVRNPGVGILSMPDEILLRILSGVRDKVTNYARIRAACFRFRALVNTTDFFRAHWAFWFGGDPLEIERRHVFAFARRAAGVWTDEETEKDGDERPAGVEIDRARLRRVEKARGEMSHADYEAILRLHVEGWVDAMGRRYPFFSVSLKGGLVVGKKGRRTDIREDAFRGYDFEAASAMRIPGRDAWRIDRPTEANLVLIRGMELGYRVVAERAWAKLARYGTSKVNPPTKNHDFWCILDFIATADLSFFASFLLLDSEVVASLAAGRPFFGTNLEDLLRSGRFDLADRMLAPIPSETVAETLSGRAAWASLGSGDPAAVPWLLDRGADLVMARSDDPPLMWACREADVVLLDALLDGLGLPCALDQAEMLVFALDAAVWKKDARKVESLLRRGVDPNSRADRTKNPLDWVIRRAATAPDRRLFQGPYEKEKTACARLVEILLRAGADVGVLFEEGPGNRDRAPILDATRDVSLMRALLSPRPPTDNAWPATWWVDPWRGFDRGLSVVQTVLPCGSYNEIVFGWLVELATVRKGEGPVGVDRKDARGETLLLRAVRAAEHARVRHLLNMGASPNGVTGSAFPLSEAARLGHVEVVKCLMRCDVDPDGPPSDAIGRDLPPPLVSAAMNLNVKCVRALLKGGADPNRRGADGWPPFWSCLFSRKRANEERTTWIALGGKPNFEYAERLETEICALLLAYDADPFLVPGGQDPLRLYRVVDAARAARIVAAAETHRRGRPFRDRRAHHAAFRRRCRLLSDKKGWRRGLKSRDTDPYWKWYAEIKGELDPDDEGDDE